MLGAEAFSPTYQIARQRFLRAAEDLGVEPQSFVRERKGPLGEELAIDVVRLGAPRPERAVVISSALHGVEGFLGSAVQTAWLQSALNRWTPPEGVGVILIHALNPFGFAWQRRVDEDNIDNNRNFRRPGEPYTGSPAGYAELDDLLNPRRPPQSMSAFWPKALIAVARHGMHKLKNVVGAGQYDFPQGLFFGGKGPSVTHRVLAEHLPMWVDPARRVLHLDFHTGLGRCATYELHADRQADSQRVRELREVFGAAAIRPWDPRDGFSYEVHGGLGRWCQTVIGDHYDVLVAEFGTHSPMRVLEALHHENRAHHWGDPQGPRNLRCRQRLQDVFSPPDERWRRAVLPKGLKIVEQALQAIPNLS